MCVGLFSHITSNKAKRLDIRKNFFTYKVIKHWNRKPRLSYHLWRLQRGERHVDRTLRDMV